MNNIGRAERRLEIRIVEVENGYVVAEDRLGHPQTLPSWVATTPDDLANLVQRLAEGRPPKKDLGEK